MSRLDWGLLSSGAALYAPGLRSVWTRIWLWIIPGYFFVRRALGIGPREPAFASLAMGFSILFGSLICLPAILLFGRPTTTGIVLSVATFALVCSLSNVRLRVAPPAVAAPSAAARCAIGLFVVWRIAHGVLFFRPDATSEDGPYFHGMVLGLSHSFPPVNFEASSLVLKQP